MSLSAKEMFEELGYILTKNTDIIYFNEEAGEKTILCYAKHIDGDDYDVISFYESKKYYCEKPTSENGVSCAITYEEHQAITQQLKELQDE